jgi:hypothetical protein
MGKFKFTIILSILTPFLLILMFMIMNGGHGSYAPAILLFPTGLISFLFFRALELPFLILGILQFPIYGLLIDKSKNKPKTAIIIVMLHVLLAILIFSVKKDSF